MQQVWQQFLHGRLLLSALFVLLFLLAAGCTPLATSPPAGGVSPPAPAAVTLNIFAAASLTNAFDEIGALFTAKQPEVRVVFNFAGSNQLAAQIGQGAPADLFAAANTAQMAAAVETGRIDAGAPRPFARNRLVVVMPSDNPAALTKLADLARPGIKLVFAAQEVPAGRYTLDFLDKAAADASLGAAYKEAVLANVLSYEESVRGVLTKVALGEADAGIVYASDALAGNAGGNAGGNAASRVQQIEIPDRLNTLASYPLAVLNDSEHAVQAQAFADFVLSPAGQRVLEKHGFLAAEAP